MASLQKALADNTLDADIETLNRKISAAKQAREHILDAIEQATISQEEAKARLQKRRQEQAGWELERSALEERRKTARMVLDDGRVLLVLDQVRAKIEADDVGVARTALRAFVTRIILRDDELKIEYNLELLIQELIEVPPREG